MVTIRAKMGQGQGSKCFSEAPLSHSKLQICPDLRVSTLMWVKQPSQQRQLSRHPDGDGGVQAGVGLGAGRIGAGHRGADWWQGVRVQRSKVTVFVFLLTEVVSVLSDLTVSLSFVLWQFFTAEARHSGRGGLHSSSEVRSVHPGVPFLC